MAIKDVRPDSKNLSIAGILIALGIVFGGLGTSPLYVMKAIISTGQAGAEFNELLLFGSVSCILWTLTIQTTIKYVLIILKVNNKGEGGIFALFALMKRKSSWAAILTMIGACALLGDGIIMPALTLSSSVEGFQMNYHNFPVIPVVLLILAVLFFMQKFGTHIIGVSFGPIMAIWFLMIGSLGLVQIFYFPEILKAANPEYVIMFLKEYPGGFILLGAVFLCVTGAEALYSDLGRVGISNLRTTWIFVKLSLLLSYFGQSAWLADGGLQTGVNPFFGIMPYWFLVPGIIISILASIIASQAFISRAYTQIAEAVSLNFWPKLQISYPSYLKGQVYVPYVNWILWIACSFVVIFFRNSSNMEAVYGLSITMTMIMTTILMSHHLYNQGVNHRLVIIMLIVFLTTEGSFLIANLNKIKYGGWFTLMIASAILIVMYGWYFGRKLKNRYVTFTYLDKYYDLFRELSKDESVPKTATNLVYIIKANRIEQVESKVIYSIFHKQPKRADTYWLLHVDRSDEPDRFDYKVTHIIPGILIRVDFHIGFKVDPKINLYFKEVLEDLMETGEVKLISSFDSLRKHALPADFKYVLIDRIMPRDYELSGLENFTLILHSLSRMLCISDVKALQLDSSNTIEEQVPITIDQPLQKRISRVN